MKAYQNNDHLKSETKDGGLYYELSKAKEMARWTMNNYPEVGCVTIDLIEEKENGDETIVKEGIYRVNA